MFPGFFGQTVGFILTANEPGPMADGAGADRVFMFQPGVICGCLVLRTKKPTQNNTTQPSNYEGSMLVLQNTVDMS